MLVLSLDAVLGHFQPVCFGARLFLMVLCWDGKVCVNGLKPNTGDLTNNVLDLTGIPFHEVGKK